MDLILVYINGGVFLAEQHRKIILDYDVESGTINLSNADESSEMNERKKYLDKHLKKYKKWQNKTTGYWCTHLPDETKTEGRRLLKKSTEEKLNDAIVFHYKQLEQNPTVEEVFTEWNDYRRDKGKIKKSTHMVNKQIFKRFYADSMGKRKIRDIDECEWEDFLCDCIADFDITAKAFSNLKGLTKGFLKRAKKRKYIKMDVEAFFRELDVSDNDFKKIKKDDSEEVFFDDEMEKIMTYIRENPDAKNLGIALMFVAGLRVGELVTLRHEDIEGTAVSVKFTETRYRDDATGRYVYYVDDAPKTAAGVRTVIIPSEQKWILDKLRLLNPFSDYIFLDRKGNRMTTPKIRQRIYRICTLVGIPPRSPHKVRKTYGSILLDNNLDNGFIISQMGHTNISCTENHYHFNKRRQEQKQAIIDGVPEFKAIYRL